MTLHPVLCYRVMGRVMRYGVMTWWRGLRYGVMVLWVVGGWDFCVGTLAPALSCLVLHVPPSSYC